MVRTLPGAGRLVAGTGTARQRTHVGTGVSVEQFLHGEIQHQQVSLDDRCQSQSPLREGIIDNQWQPP